MLLPTAFSTESEVLHGVVSFTFENRSFEQLGQKLSTFFSQPHLETSGPISLFRYQYSPEFMDVFPLHTCAMCLHSMYRDTAELKAGILNNRIFKLGGCGWRFHTCL